MREFLTFIILYKTYLILGVVVGMLVRPAWKHIIKPFYYHLSGCFAEWIMDHYYLHQRTPQQIVNDLEKSLVLLIHRHCNNLNNKEIKKFSYSSEKIYGHQLLIEKDNIDKQVDLLVQGYYRNPQGDSK